MDLTEAFAPGAPGEDLGKTDFFDFVVSPPPHCASGGAGGVVITDDDNFLHRTCARGMSFLHQDPRHDDHDSRDIHTSSGVSFIKETNNNTLTALPPVSTITGSLSHHNAVRNHGCPVTGTEQVPMDQSDCDYWGGSDGKEQTCNILLEDLNKYCWSAHTNSQAQNDNVAVVHGGNEAGHRTSNSGGCTGNDRHQNTDGAIYTLTVLNNEANSMDALDCCKSPAAPSNDSWSLRPNLDLDAILSMEPSPAEQEHDVQNSVNDVTRTERFHVIATPSSQYTTDDSGFVESKDSCGRGQNNSHVDNNNDWKLSDQNHLQDAVAAAAAAANDSAESLLRSALQGKLYSGTTQIASPSSSQSSTMSLSVTNSTASSLQLLQDQGQQQQQMQQDESMHGCTEEDLLLSQLETTTYRPGDYEKLKSIANEVVESYCNLEPVCNVSATTTVMYTLDPTSGSLGTITLPADLGQVGTVTVVTAAQQDQLVQAATTTDITPVTTTTTNNTQIPITPSRGGGTKAPKKYSRKPKGSAANSANANGNSGTASCSGNGNTSNGQATSGNGGSPGSLPRKERSLHYCSICSKGFKDKYSVNVHIRTHTGEKPFACSICGKSFRQKAHLAKHYQTHITQKPNVGSAGSSASSNASNTSPTCTDVVTSTRTLPDSATACNPSS
ncbi:protein sister of odd and bowel-like [Venturia canescens]|uniref:protein sister of odd and bowel-like n=1 Tax=Venturia canescens TaxID=32260 RepID=UPI001C9D41C6|nr:protein sister of odd and bowel-like [Venturia canescens]